MKSAFVSKENNEVTFTMEFTAEEFDAATDKAYKDMRGRISVDGFRKGKAPRSIIEKRYGEGIFFEEAVDSLLNDNYTATLDELNIEPIDRPDIQFAEEKLEKGKGFTVNIKVPVAPEVEPKDYIGVEAERKIRVITDKDIDLELQAAQKKAARLVTVDKPAELGNTVILDYAGFVGEEQFEGGTAEDQTLELGSGQFIPGFEDQLVGVSAGEKKDVVVTFPETYHAENLAGKEAVFHCTVKEVKAEELPEINDDFALDVSEYDTLEEYKAGIRKTLEESAAAAAEYDGKNAVMDKVYAANPVDVPAVMINDEAENMMNEFSQNMQQQGLSIDMYLKYTGQTRAQLKNGFLDDAKKRVASRLVVKAIAAKEGIEASEEDLQKEYEDMAKMYGMEVEQLKSVFGAANEKYLKEDIAMRKAIDYIYSKAVLTDVEDKPEEQKEAAVE